MNREINSTALVADRIAEFTTEMVKAVPPDVVAVLGAELKTLTESGIVARALKIGDRAPEFSPPDSEERMVSLTPLLAKGPVVVTFYRGGWCPFAHVDPNYMNRLEPAAILDALHVY